jgi:hypothetical protein
VPRIELELSRLRRGELIAGVSGIVLLASVLLLPWYGTSAAVGALGRSSSATGWSSLSILRWLILLDSLAGLALALCQAALRAPAVPVTLSIVASALGIPTAIAVIYRVLINLPGPDNLIGQRVGAFVGLVAALALVYGALRSLREEGIAPGDAVAPIPTVRPAGQNGS